MTESVFIYDCDTKCMSDIVSSFYFEQHVPTWIVFIIVAAVFFGIIFIFLLFAIACSRKDMGSLKI